jgi:Putative DNA-binding domain
MTNNWNIQKLQSYIDNQVEENLNLDYKAADALQKQPDSKKKDISINVSAMANAAGGVIIYGVKEFDDKAKRHLPEKITPINRVDISKEWLEQVINTNIQPKIEGLIITPVTIDETKGTVAYVIEIPQSTTAHQANDKKYYKRYNFESVAMEDYEIRDIMSRLKHPNVTLEFIIEKVQAEEQDPITGGPKVQLFPHQKVEPKKWIEYTLKIAIRNTGKVYANYINYYLELPKEILDKEEHLKDSENRSDYKMFYRENTIRDITGIKAQLLRNTIYEYGPSRYDPVLPGTRSRYQELRLIDDLQDWDKKLYWTIYADNAEVRTGSHNLSEIVIK